MIDDILQGMMNAIMCALHEMAFEFLEKAYTSLFDNMNGQVALIAGELAKTPDSYNSTINTAILNISNTVIVPIGVMIITALFCYELINGVLEKNAMHEMGTEFIFKWLGKACIGVLLLSYTFDISNAIFELGAEVVTTATPQIISEVDIDASVIDSMLLIYDHYTDQDGDGECDWQEYDYGIGELLSMGMEAYICRFAIIAMYVCIKLLIAVRMIEIYMYLSVSPIPFATFINRDWSNIGTGYVKKLAGLSFQAFFMLICLAIYYVMVGQVNTAVTGASDLHEVTLALLVTCGALILGIKGSKNIAESIFSGH